MVVRFVETRLDEDDDRETAPAPQTAEDRPEGRPKGARTKVFGVREAGVLAVEEEEEAGFVAAGVSMVSMSSSPHSSPSVSSF